MRNTTVAAKIARGYSAVLCAAVLWGIGSVVAKELLNAGLSAQVLMSVRMGGGGLVLAILLALRPELRRVKPTELAGLTLLGVLLALFNYTQALAIQLTNVATGVMMQFLGLVLVMLHARVALGRPITLLRLTCIVMALAGSYAMLTRGTELAFGIPGLLAGLANAASYSVYVIVADRQAKYLNPWTVLSYTMITAGLLFSLWVPPWAVVNGGYTLVQWGLFAYLVVPATVLSFLLYFLSLHYIEALQASMVVTLKPVVAAAGAHLLIGERLRAAQIVGAAMILASVVLLQASRAERRLSSRRVQEVEAHQVGAGGANSRAVR